MRRQPRARGVGLGLAPIAFACLVPSFAHGTTPAVELSDHVSNATAATESLAAPVDVGECVEFDELDDESAVKVRMHSTCERPLRCELTWTLTCQAGRHTDEAAAFRLAPGQERVTRASADACGDDGWSIDSLEWSCIATQR